MNLRHLAVGGAALAATVLGTQNAHAVFGVNLATTTSDAVQTGATQLYNDAAFTDASEVGDPIWLVFDVDGDGIFNLAGGGVGTTPSLVPYAPGGVTAADLRASLIDVDDYVVFTSIPGPLEGRISQNITGLPSTLQLGGTGANDAGGDVRPSYALIFDNAVFSDGGTFGFNGALAESGLIPAVGNVNLRIGENTFAGPYSFVPVPEPAAAAYVALALAGAALLRRRFPRA